MTLLSLKRRLFFPLLCAGLSGSAHAVLSETWFVEGEPSRAQVEKWKTQLPAKAADRVSLRIELKGSPSEDLATRLQSTGIRKIQIVSATYPLESQIARWQAMAKQGIELAYVGGLYPTPKQIQTLNTIQFPRTLLVLAKYLDYQAEDTLLPLRINYALHYAQNRYPDYMHTFALNALPREVPLQVTVDYWPRYIQMDNLNLIRGREKRLKIVGTPISAGSIPYTQNLENVAEIIFESDIDPNPAQWETLERFPIRWVLKKKLPSATHLEALKAWVGRGTARFKLSLDPERPANAEERAFYDALPFDVEWTSDAP